MYRIDKAQNRISRLETPSFSDLGFKERAHIQEWIAHQPDVLGEELLIIQKEFSGFSETNERLDLLALDKQGALVLIENKLDDAGRDVTWQALKYASYCSRLTRDQVVNIYQEFLDKTEPGQSAAANLCEFFDEVDVNDIDINKGITQRIMLVAAKFRKEVTSTVLWLMNFKIQLQCFRTTPYRMGDELYVSFEQIIPTKGAEESMIGLAEKALDEVGDVAGDKGRHAVRRQFWAKLIEKMRTVSTLYASVGPSKASWISASSGVRGLGLNFVATQWDGRAELYIDRGDKVVNEAIYNDLLAQKESIEAAFGQPLIWQRLDAKRACRIKYETEGNVFDQDNWPTMVDAMIAAMCKLDKALEQPLSVIEQKLKSGTYGTAAAASLSAEEGPEVEA